jgi:hypothetical protein
MMPSSKKYSKTACAVISCNVSYKNEIDEPTLVDVLFGKASLEPWKFHLDTFFNELPEDIITGVMHENGLTVQNLAYIFHSLHPVFQGNKFKEFLNDK